jgi:hypothetical protein
MVRERNPENILGNVDKEEDCEKPPSSLLFLQQNNDHNI